MTDVPFAANLAIYLGAVSLLLAMATLLFMLLNRIRRTFKRLRAHEIKHISIPQNVLRFLFTIIWIMTSLAILFMAAFVQSFSNFTKEQLVAEVRCHALEDTSEVMLMQLTPIVDGEEMATEGFVLNGEQWALEGDILTWDNWINFAGMHTMYKLTRIKGRYLDIEAERNRRPSVYSLVEKEDDPQWRWLYKYGYRLRFVDSVYGNTVYTYPSTENVYQVFVTTSGFSVKVKETDS